MWQPCDEQLDKALLLARDPILFYDEVLLYESELDDNGASQLCVKARSLYLSLCRIRLASGIAWSCRCFAATMSLRVACMALEVWLQHMCAKVSTMLHRAAAQYCSTVSRWCTPPPAYDRKQGSPGRASRGCGALIWPF